MMIRLKGKTEMTTNDSIYEVYAATKVGPWRALQMREISRVDYDFRLSEAQRISDEDSEEHTDECSWERLEFLRLR